MVKAFTFKLAFRFIVLGMLLATYLCCGVAVRAQATSSLLITEVQTQSATSKTEEFVEIYNPTADDISLSTLQVKYLSAAGGVSVMSLSPSVGNTVLKAHGYLLLVQSSYALASDATFTTGLSDTGGHIQLSLGGVVVDTVGWGTVVAPEGHSAPVAAKGKTISRISASGTYQDTNDNAADFQETVPSPVGGGLVEQVPDVCPNMLDIQEVVPPGYELDQTGNCVIKKACLLEISEISAQPNYNGQEYVELKNNSVQTMSTSLCKLRINGGSDRVMAESELAPGAFYVVSFSSGAIRNSAGEVTLVDSNGQALSYAYPETLAGETVNIIAGTATAVLSSMPTPGTENVTITPSEEEAPGSGSSSGTSAALATCPEGKYRNPATNRCKSYETTSATLQPCDEGQERNPETNRCRKITTATATLTPCKAGQERNPETNRCRSITTASATLKPCEPGQERNPETNRCRKVSEEIDGALSADEAISNNVRTPLTFGLKLVLLVLAGLLAYGVYEYRTDIRNLFDRFKDRRTARRPPD